MKRWLGERPWIWIVIFLGLVVIGSLASVIVAELNRPEIVKPPRPDRHSSIHFLAGRASYAVNSSLRAK